METVFKATEIAQTLCKAEGQDLRDHPEILRRVRNLAEKGVLHPLRAIDARGTLVFAPLEVFRAALASELSGLGLFAPVIMEAFRAASFDHPTGGRVAPSRMTEAGILSRGGLRNSIAGIAAGEDWNLHIWRQPPGLTKPEELRAAYAWSEIPAEEITALSVVAEAEGVRPVRSRAVIQLRPIFAPLIELVGVPE